ncbi:helix-turn-helix transcriptional regulator [Thermomonospora cellulosilytica]|uniref:Transcriptional regulator with XRE-family HTH domain n=1 Tax=Thermomonospora cellulosilytica TaxID=1411118 RepID=A0A7W3R6R7_9ACTN|nr:helix-turn-helix transcriptional regulator [Thermomonospora cellulosilytica]MBA9001620.1 transcriptional regulator with XRE-family HTH domain [Thermomonospora cellulosilytica]
MDDRSGAEETESGGGRPIDPRAELGEFLRSRRARLKPEDAGLPAFGRHRRVPGLRREELAQLAGVSVAYLTRLEQGRGHNVSAEVIDALARALRLTDAEHRHLAHLAARRHRGRRPPQRPHVRAGLREMLACLQGVPAYVTGRCSDILAWNPMAAALFGDWDRLPPHERNWARLVFLRPDHRRLFVDWESKAADVVGALRLDAGRDPDDPRLSALVGELSVKSEEFRRLWARHDVKEKSHGTQRLHHPLVGDLTLSFESFWLPDDPEQCLTVYHARPGSTAAESLRSLTERGVNALTDRAAAT